MFESLKGKVVLITGAGEGIGLSIAKFFYEKECYVYLNDVNEELCEKAVKVIVNENAQKGGEIESISFDVSDLKAVDSKLKYIEGKHQSLDILVANAGITNYGSFLSYDERKFDRLMAVNLKGSYFMSQYVAKQMIKNKKRGRIILLSSVMGSRVLDNLSAYGISKAGIQMMTKCLAVELGPYGITVNAVSPGATVTKRTLADDPDFESNWSSVNPTEEICRAEDVGGAVLFLATNEAKQITGQTITVDGGWSLKSPVPSGHPDEPEVSSKTI